MSDASNHARTINAICDTLRRRVDRNHPIHPFIESMRSLLLDELNRYKAGRLIAPSLRTQVLGAINLAPSMRALRPSGLLLDVLEEWRAETEQNIDAIVEEVAEGMELASLAPGDRRYFMTPQGDRRYVESDEINVNIVHAYVSVEGARGPFEMDIPGYDSQPPNKTAAEEALDEIAAMSGCPEWDYPGQVVRDAKLLVEQRDEARREAAAWERRAREACGDNLGCSCCRRCGWPVPCAAVFDGDDCEGKCSCGADATNRKGVDS